jgi:hypothetical protein
LKLLNEYDVLSIVFHLRDGLKGFLYSTNGVTVAHTLMCNMTELASSAADELAVEVEFKLAEPMNRTENESKKIYE